MPSSLSSELSNYRYIDEIKSTHSFINGKDFFDSEKLPAHLVKIGAQMGSPTNKITASMIVKRMAFYGVIHLYAMSVWNKRLVVDIDELKVVENPGDPLWLPEFYFGEYTFIDVENVRTLWREEVIAEVFSGFFHPLLETLRNVTRFSKLVMWENIAIYIFWLYESLLNNEEYNALHNRLRDDFHFIVHEASPALFGPYKNNPLSRFDSEKVIREKNIEPIRVRKTCCFSNLLEKKKNRCSTCPNGCNMPPI
ncbi:IucA/IucC family C-terminal-domain containing protein [Heyndrickxia vini]|uniref:Aerobactin siderophore biosynthesis IucA/IucC-like C-terminal domain-containing protein n=1 Tax=Heyndrickxia vini TaxID=1476025 RepID=A0ABX7E4S5_9BACI|nr:IucA/IucC family C-terminal-domain containing protein [Heyndrickxia vini]QQZ10472.1 hypothetical protein I5776_05945 [Heyndrickxia vini]